MYKCSGTGVQLAHSNERSAFWSGVLPQQILDGTLTHLDYYECARLRCRAAPTPRRPDASAVALDFLFRRLEY